MSDAVLTGLDTLVYKKDDERIKSRQPAKQDKKTAVLKKVVLALFILVFLQALLYMVVIPCLVPAKIYYKGNSKSLTPEITSALQSLNSKTWMQFKKNKAQAAILQIPGIEDVEVKKHFPDKVEINVKQRIPVAKILVETEKGSVPIQIDKKGVLFPIKEAEAFEDSRIPLISGITVNKVQNDMRIPEKYRSLIDDIYTIQSLPQNYFAVVSEIQVVQKEYGNFELVLYPINSHIKVLTDRLLTEKALQYMMVALDVIDTFEPDVAAIDLRYGSVIYRKASE